MYVETLILSRNNASSIKTSAQYKWFLLCVLVGGKRGLARLSSIWQLNQKKRYQFDELLGSSVMTAMNCKLSAAQLTGFGAIRFEVNAANSNYFAVTLQHVLPAYMTKY